MKRRAGKFGLIAAAGVAGLVVVSFMVMTSSLPAGAATVQTVTQEAVQGPWTPPAPEQPIPYSHKTHLALPGMDCETCHTNPTTAEATMGFPATSLCMQCHATVSQDTPAVQKLAQYDTSQEPVPWVRVYTVLPGVKWDHLAHLDVTCQTCHGDVAQLEQMAEVTSVTTMFGCLNCHTKRAEGTSNFRIGELSENKLTQCTTCHSWFVDPILAAGGKTPWP